MGDTSKEWTWDDTVGVLKGAGLVKNPALVLPLVYVCDDAPQGWHSVAAETAEYHGGTHMPLAQGVRYGQGSNLGGLILDRGYWEKVVCPARSICQWLMKTPYADLPNTTGGCIRALLKWVCPPVKCSPMTKKMLLGRVGMRWDDEEGAKAGYQWHDCTPGKYDRAKVHRLIGRPLKPNENELTQFDCSGYYYQMMSRDNFTLRPLVYPNRLEFDPWTANEAARWAELLQAVGGIKVLRNSIYGNCLGGTGHTTIYCRDMDRMIKEKVGETPSGKIKYKDTDQPNPDYGVVVAKQVKMDGGPFPAAGLVIARTGYETCMLESIATGSVYSTVDSVTCLPNAKPYIWTSYGIRYDIARDKAGNQIVGPGEICARGNWAIGKTEKVAYQNGDRTPIEVMPRVWQRQAHCDNMGHIYCNDWL